MASNCGYNAIQHQIADLDALSRTRALSNAESLELERLIKAERQYFLRAAPRRCFWTQAEESTALRLREAGKTYAAIAKEIGRSLAAVSTRLREMRGAK